MLKAPPITDREYEMLASFRYALRLFFRFSEEAAAEVGLTPQQYQALLAIKGYPGRESITIGDLAERLQLRHHSIVGLVDRMAAQGLVVRTPSRDDRRQVYVSLTSRGAELLEQLAVVHREELRRIGPHLHSLLNAIGGRGNGV